MLFKTGQAASIFLKHRMSKAKDVFGKAKNVTKSKFAAGKAKASSIKGKTAQILKGQKKVFTEYKGSFLKTLAKDRLEKLADDIMNLSKDEAQELQVIIKAKLMPEVERQRGLLQDQMPQNNPQMAQMGRGQPNNRMASQRDIRMQGLLQR